MRINQYLAKSGFGSRRSSEQLILDGRVKVNGDVVKELSFQIIDSDEVLVDDKKAQMNKQVYYLVNKPVGYVCSVDDPQEKKLVTQLVPNDPPVYPVGRLDKNSEGLIILTNDGEFAQRHIHAQYGSEKEYLVTARGPRKDFSQKLEKVIKYFKCGVKLDNKRTQPAFVRVIGQAKNEVKLQIILKEGLNRQIRRTLSIANFEVVKLKRIRIDDYKVEDIALGEYFEISPKIKK